MLNAVKMVKMAQAAVIRYREREKFVAAPIMALNITTATTAGSNTSLGCSTKFGTSFMKMNSSRIGTLKVKTLVKKDS